MKHAKDLSYRVHIIFKAMFNFKGHRALLKYCVPVTGSIYVLKCLNSLTQYQYKPTLAYMCTQQQA